MSRIITESITITRVWYIDEYNAHGTEPTRYTDTINLSPADPLAEPLITRLREIRGKELEGKQARFGWF